MKKSLVRSLAALMSLVLTLSLLAGCGADTPETPDTPAPVQSQQAVPNPGGEASAQPSTKPSEPPAAEPTATPEPTSEPAATPEPTPEPTPEATPEPTKQGPEDGNYTAGVTLAGGSGRASVQSPAALRCVGGQFYATIVWSSPNYDYMKVDGVRYELVSGAGENSAFEIPVAAFDTALPVIADTVAMSEPHEVEYTLTFDSSTLVKQ